MLSCWHAWRDRFFRILSPGNTCEEMEFSFFKIWFILSVLFVFRKLLPLKQGNFGLRWSIFLMKLWITIIIVWRLKNLHQLKALFAISSPLLVLNLRQFKTTIGLGISPLSGEPKIGLPCWYYVIIIRTLLILKVLLNVTQLLSILPTMVIALIIIKKSEAMVSQSWEI